MAIAPLPPRLIPQSRLGVGLAVYIVLVRYDDHLSFYRLAQQFQERPRVVIARQQMVQWVEAINETRQHPPGPRSTTFTSPHGRKLTPWRVQGMINVNYFFPNRKPALRAIVI